MLIAASPLFEHLRNHSKVTLTSNCGITMQFMLVGHLLIIITRFTDQLLGGQSDASFNGNCVDGSGGAWKVSSHISAPNTTDLNYWIIFKEIGEKSNAMAKMVGG